MGDSFVTPVVASQRVEFSVTSRGQLRFLSAEDAEHLFFDPATASVDELLRLAYARLDERSQHEAQQTLRLNLK